MSERADVVPDEGRAPLRSTALRLLAFILFAESAALVAVVVFLVVESTRSIPASYASAIGLMLLCAIGAAWVAVIAVNTLRGRAWIRGAAITVQVLQIALAIGSFQGLFARPDVGWFLLAPAIVALLLLFTRSVLEATTRRD